MIGSIFEDQQPKLDFCEHFNDSSTENNVESVLEPSEVCIDVCGNETYGDLFLMDSGELLGLREEVIGSDSSEPSSETHSFRESTLDLPNSSSETSPKPTLQCFSISQRKKPKLPGMSVEFDVICFTTNQYLRCFFCLSNLIFYHIYDNRFYIML